MNKQNTLIIILLIAIIGICFSGYLSYNEVINQVCVIGGSCPFVYNIPACIYGLIMYIAVAIFAIIGLKSENINWNVFEHIYKLKK